MNFPRATAFALDTAMCAMMFALQRRHKRHAASRLEIEEYIAACEGMTRDGYFAAPAVDDEERSTLKWPSPIATAFPANDRTHIDLFPCPAG